MSESSPFEHTGSFEAGEVSGALRLGRFEAHYEEVFAEALEDGVITDEERESLDRTAKALGLDSARIVALEEALQAAYEARRKVRVVGATRAPTTAPLAEARPTLAPFEGAVSIPAQVATAPQAAADPGADPRVAVLEARIAELQARIAELEMELEEARDQVAVEVDLSGAAAGAASIGEVDDPEELVRRLRPDPRDADLLRALFRAFGRRGEIDRQLSAARALDYLGAAGSDERELVSRFRGEGLIRPTAALPRESWWRLLFNPEQEVLVGEIFSAVIGPVLLGRISTLRREKALPQLDPARRQDPAVSTLQAVRCFAWASAIFGMQAPPLYADGTLEAAVEVVPATTPSLRLGKRALSGRTPAELAFLAGRELAYFRQDHFVRVLLPSIPDLEDIFLAALHIASPALPLTAAVRARVTPIAQAIEPILEPAQIDRLRGQFLRFVEEGGRTNLQRWANAVDSTARRAGLLLADDLRAAESMLAIVDPAGKDEAMDDLLVFVTGDRYSRLRRQLGIAVEG